MQRIITPPEKARASAIGNVLKMMKIGCVFPKIWSRTDKHTQTDTLITILRSPIGGGVKTSVLCRRPIPYSDSAHEHTYTRAAIGVGLWFNFCTIFPYSGISFKNNDWSSMRKCMGSRVAGPKRTLAASVLPLVSHSEQTPAVLLSPLPGQTWRRAQNRKYVLLLYLLVSKHTQACTQSTFAQAFRGRLPERQ